MWNPEPYLRPIAHRGLHDTEAGIIENSWPAFEAAIEAGYGIECDVQRTRDDQSVVFHDATLARLTARSDPVANLTSEHLSGLRYANSSDTILTLSELLSRVKGRVPVLIEIKHDWTPPSGAWIAALCQTVANAHGPIALMSFDPEVMMMVKRADPTLTRGLVSGIFRKPGRSAWWPDAVDAHRADALSKLKESDTVEPNFIAYHVEDLEQDAVTNARRRLGLPVFTWTVRTPHHWALCRQFADAAIFEGQVPSRDKT